MANKNNAPTKNESQNNQSEDIPNDNPIINNVDERKTKETREGDSELATALAEAKTNKEGWQRTLAEFQNYRRRVEREQTETRIRIVLDTLARVLPVIDDFERALDNIPEALVDDPFVNGVSLIQGKLNKLLEDYEIEVFDPTGEEFDPNHHQAISMEDSDDHNSGIVIETLQKGYISGNTLLRPAMVRVSN